MALTQSVPLTRADVVNSAFNLSSALVPLAKTVCVSGEMLSLFLISQPAVINCPIAQLKHAQQVDDLPSASGLSRMITAQQQGLFDFSFSSQASTHLTGPAQMVSWLFNCPGLETNKLIQRLETDQKEKLGQLVCYLSKMIQSHPEKAQTFEQLKASELMRMVHCIPTNDSALKEIRQELAMQAVAKRMVYTLDDLPKDLRSLSFAVKAIIENPNSILNTDDLSTDDNFKLHLIQRYRTGSLVLNTHTRLSLLNDRDIVLAAVTHDGHSLRVVGEHLQSDREIVIAAVGSYVNALFYANDVLKNDREVVLKAVRFSGFALHYASPRLRSDAEVVLSAVTNFGNALSYASSEVQNNKEVVLPAVKQEGKAFQFSSIQLQHDKEVVLAAVTQDWKALVWAAPALREEAEILSVACLHNADAADVAYVLNHVVYSPQLLASLSDDLKQDYDIARAAIRNNGLAFEFVCDAFKNSFTLAHRAVVHNGLSLQFGSDSIRSNADIVQAAVQQNGLALQFACQALRDDPEIVMEAIAQNPGAIQFATPNMRQRFSGQAL